MKRILMIATGGTIAARPSKEGLRPEISPAEILSSCPGINSVAEIGAEQLLDLDSTDMRPGDWLKIARCIRENYAAYDGFVITHGTDTMAYTAAALSYLIQSSPKSIVLTGAQKSICMEDTDARRNLLDAFAYAADEYSHGVSVVFDGKVIPGARARKLRTRSRNAFSSIDYPSPALLLDGRLLRFFREELPAGGPVFYDSLNKKVFVLKLIPGLDAGIFDALRERYDALVVEGFGMGGLPSYGDGRFLSAARAWCASGRPLVITTQVPYEGSDLMVYQVGLQVMAELPAMEARSMTLEAVVTKLMWILAQTRDLDKVRKLFYTPIAHDLL